ncbi:hypothetical protein K3495_g9651 [Podosphaera aphanis]|nr:hypothetical protein K3495_g9651 [Podosphaera aphanis]
MGSKLKIQGLNTMHTSGIFSDMSVDGPEIGTLVVIVDRAKNLPNRKTIGKQDPYCAARLGKEAKKTETDRRGGQTPRWDQELRYTVHDSPDYYQLKVSIFNDDKKTDLIGETWVDLKDVIIPGGGQNDLWHNLNCKGKYAGEIRVEITYYDSRPKQEKPEKPKQTGICAAQVEPNEASKGTRQAKPGVKRRPLPSDPITGKPAVVPASPVQHHEQYNRNMLSGKESASMSSMRSLDQGESLTNISDNTQFPSQSHRYHQSEIPDHVQTPPREYQFSSTATSELAQTPRSYQTNPSTTTSEHYKTPQHLYPSPSYLAQKSLLQNNAQDNLPYYSPTIHENYPSKYVEQPETTLVTSHQQNLDDRNETYDSMPQNDFNHHSRTYRSETENLETQDYNSQNPPYEIPPPENFGSPPSPGGPPPRPPAHRSRNTFNHVNHSISNPAMNSQGNIGNPPESHSPQHYTDRNSMRLHNRSSSYQAYSPERDQEKYRRSQDENYEGSSNQCRSYDSRYVNDICSMQPTVEDAPPSPTSTRFQYNYLEDRPRGLPGGTSSNPALSQSYNRTPNGEISNNVKSQISYRDNSSRPSTSEASRKELSSKIQSEYHNRDSMRSGISQVPATLLPGMDPLIAQEISNRIYDEKPANFSQTSGNLTQGRNQNSSRQQQSQLYREEKSIHSRKNAYTSAMPAPPTGDKSPDSRRSMTRKSVSSSPIRPDDKNYLSSMPYGPESYNSLNPIVTASSSNPSLAAAYNIFEEHSSKIITHDGREIDPSDHIPESNYAPLPETKNSKHHASKPLPSTQNLPRPVGRRPLRQAVRPQVSTAVSNRTPTVSNISPQSPAKPQVGRNRLQKISARVSKYPESSSTPSVDAPNYEGLSNEYKFNHHSAEKYSQSSYYNNPDHCNARVSAPPNPPKILPTNKIAEPWPLVHEMQNVDLRSARTSRRNY